jgi:tetratricopeptide (TPR) repeat protein
MKKAILTAVVLSFLLSGVSFGQNEADQVYIKAMSANSPQEKATLLKDYIAKFGGKGGQYDNFAYAYLFQALIQSGKTDAETLGFGEKALTFSGLDDSLKAQTLVALATIYSRSAQTAEKAKTTANQLLQHANAAKGKEAEAANAAMWNNMIGASHFIIGQALDKAKDYKGAVDAYFSAYGILKDAKILAEIKKLGKALYDGGNFAEAEKVYRVTYATLKDGDSLSLLSRSLYKQGKTTEALVMFKEAFAKSKTGEMAYNIGVTLAGEAKTNPGLTAEAIRFLLDASVLGTKNAKQAQQAMQIAEGLFYGQDKEWNSRVAAIQESNKLIEEWTKTLNTKFKDKAEDELTSDEKREFRRLNENLERERKIVEGIQAKSKATMDGFQKLVAEAKSRNGK